MKFGCVIPARYGSTRLPGKPLADIAGKPMIERVYARVSQATKTECTIVATDDERVYSAVQNFGGSVMMTDPNHPTGTDRLAEVANHYTDLDVIPYPRHDFVRAPLKHIGIYAYRRDFLLNYAKMEPTPAEQTESLEQLRALENGYTIRVILTDKRFIGVDTPEDLARVNAIYEQEEK